MEIKGGTFGRKCDCQGIRWGKGEGKRGNEDSSPISSLSDLITFSCQPRRVGIVVVALLAEPQDQVTSKVRAKIQTQARETPKLMLFYCSLSLLQDLHINLTTYPSS